MFSWTYLPSSRRGRARRTSLCTGAQDIKGDIAADLSLAFVGYPFVAAQLAFEADAAGSDNAAVKAPVV